MIFDGPRRKVVAPQRDAPRGPAGPARRRSTGAAVSALAHGSRCAPKLVALGRQAPAGLQVPLPAVQIARQRGALHHAELRQVGLQVRAATLNLPAVQGDRRGVVVRLGEPAVGVGDPLVGQALEERVQVLVVAADPPRREPGGQEDGVDPVRLVVAQHRAHQLRRDREPVAELLVRNGFAHRTFREVEDHGLWRRAAARPDSRCRRRSGRSGSMIGSNSARSGSSSGSPAAGAQRAFSAASTGAIRSA